MKKAIPFVFLMLLSLAPLGLGTDEPHAHRRATTPFEARVDAYLRPYEEMKCFSGAVIVARKGRVLLRKGYGMANYELNVPNTAHTKFQIASLSKAFTAAAIMILQERGRLSATDPLSRFVPDYPRGDEITLHHLLSHTSGIPNVNDFPEYDEQSKTFHTLDQVVEMFKHRPLDFKPGEKYEYSNSNYNLLALVIEKASDESYGDFLKRNVFDPLGMRDTGHRQAETLLANRAAGYVPTGLLDLEAAPYIDWSIKTGNGSLYSTVGDLYRWDRALYSEKILKRSTREEMFRKGYGWFVRERFHRRLFRYSGRSPGFAAEIQRYTDDDACVIVLSNNYAGVATLIASDLAAMVFGEKYEMPEVVRPPRLDSKVLDAYVGRYEGDAEFIRPGATLAVENIDGQLFMRWSTGANVLLVPQSATKFLDKLFWATVTFVRDQKGEVTGLVWHYDQDYYAKRTRNHRGAPE